MSKYAVKRDDVTLSARLVRAMREAILDGDLEPGRHLSERELCEMFGVSRSLVREAIQTLAAEDLMTIIPHKGPMVSLLDQHSARNLYRVRAALEGLACAEFARHAGAGEVEELTSIADRLGGLQDGAAPEALIAAKNDFYRCLLNGTKNPVLGQMFTQLNNRIVQLRRLSLSRQGRLAQSVREIQAIVSAIRNRDPDAARRLAEEHVVAAARVADERFEELSQKRTERVEPNG